MLGCVGPALWVVELEFASQIQASARFLDGYERDCVGTVQPDRGANSEHVVAAREFENAKKDGSTAVSMRAIPFWAQ